MKFKLALFTSALVFILAGSNAVYSSGKGARATENSQKTKTISFTCPPRIQVEPAKLAGGWISSGKVFVELSASIQINTDSATKQRSAVCSYGQLPQLFTIEHPVPTGYACKIESMGTSLSTQAICTKKLLIGPGK